MEKNLKDKHDVNIGITEELLHRNEFPEDYHCTCDYCTNNFLGEIYNTEIQKYYSQRARNKYYNPDAGTHIAPGHFLGYRWAIQKFTQEGDWVFDPTVGTGTAIVESINHNRNGIGIELEFPEIAKNNIDYQYKRETDPPKGKSLFLPGDARNLTELLTKNGVKENQISLVINGTPYPKIGPQSSDCPQRRNFHKDENGRLVGHVDKTFDYKVEKNFGLLKGDEYWDLIKTMYLDSIPFMKKGGKMVILIKDMVKNKEPFLLHKMVIDKILDNTESLKYYGSFMHKHTPPTLFMSTYSKIYPDAKAIPLYQTGIVLEKI